MQTSAARGSGVERFAGMSNPYGAPVKPERRTNDLFPLTTDFESVRGVRSKSRIPRDLIGEAPDVSRDWFDSDEDYERWVDEGSQFFMEVI